MPEDDMTLWQRLGASANKFNNSSWGQMAPAAVGALAPIVTGGNSTLLGNLGMGIGGAVALANPLIGAGIMAASALGNAAFGSNINEGAVKDYQNRIVNYSRPNINAQDNTQLMNQLGSLGSLTINKSDLGTQGWFSHKLDKKYDSLMADLGAANASRGSLIDSAVSNVDKMNDMRIASNYKASGGPLSGFDPLLKKRFPDEPSLEDQMKYHLLSESVPGMPVVYPSTFELRTKAQRAINTYRQNKKFEKQVQERRSRAEKVLEKLDEFDNKYLGDKLFRQNGYDYDRGSNIGDFYTYSFGGPMFGYMSDGAIAYDMARDNLMAKLWNAQNKKQADLATNSFKKGGMMATDFDLGLSFINAGGSHEENPYGGVPLGVDPEGVMNMGEEGEVIFKDFVFSNRLAVPKAIRSKYKLREKKDTKLSFADAMKEYFKKNGVDERENDPIIQNGLMAFASDLAMSQEMLNAKRGKTNKFAGGGYISYDRSKNSDNYFNDLYKEDSDYMKALNWYNDPAHIKERDALIAAINSGTFDNDVEKINNFTVTPDNWYRLATDYKKGPVHNAVISMIGREFSPFRDKALREANPTVAATSAPTAPEVTYDDVLLAGLDGNWTPEEIARVFPPQGPAVTSRASLLDRAAEMNRAVLGKPGGLIGRSKVAPAGEEEVTTGNVVTPNRRSNIASLLAHTGALAYNLLDPYRPGVIDEIGEFNTISGTPVGQYAPEFYTDTRYNANRLAQQANATRAAIMNNINPDRWGTLLAADYNAQIAQGEQLRADKLAEYDAFLKTRGFNRETDSLNSKTDLEVAESNANRKQAYDNSRMQQAQYNIGNYDAFKRGQDAAIGQSITGIADWFNADRRERDNLAMVAALRDSGALQSNDTMDLLYNYMAGIRPTRKRKGGK